MKTYKFEVKVQTPPKSGNFAKGLLDEVSDERLQADLTYAINLETTKVHRKILVDFIQQLNNELKPLGFEFIGVKKSMYPTSNEYAQHVSSLSFRKPNANFIIKVSGVVDMGFEDSKYTTYTGKYNIMMGQGAHHYSENITYHNLKEGNEINDALDKLRYNLKLVLADRVSSENEILNQK
jgi:hypothetical protein